MKNIFTVLLSTLMAITAFAADVTGRISISFYGNKDYQAFIDGQRINSDDDRIYLNNIRPGRHTIEVYRLKRNNKQQNKPVSSGRFTFRPQYDLDIIVDKFGNTRFNETKAYDNNRYNRERKMEKVNRGNNGHDRDRDDDDRWNRNGNNDDRDRDYNDRYDNDRRWDNNREWNKDNDNNNSYNKAISDAEFEQVLTKIRSKLFGKLNEARNAVQSHYFTSGQVKQILQLFSSDDERLDLARLAYTNVVDRNNYTRQLYSVLSASSRSELESYIRNYRSQTYR